MTFIDDLNPDRFLVAGDWHAQGYQAKAALKSMVNENGDNINVLVHVGDFSGWRDSSSITFLDKLSEKLVEQDAWCLFVDGNHENYNVLNTIPLDQEGYRTVRERVIHLPRGFRWTWYGIKFGALGGAHSVDHQWRKPGVSWWADEYVNDQELEAFRSGGPVDVVFMHDSPAGAPNEIVDDEKSQETAFRKFGPYNMRMAREHRERLATAIDPTDPAMIFHGHYHRRMEATYTRDGGRECRVIGLDQGGNLAKNTFLFDTLEMQAQLLTTEMEVV